MPGPMLGPYRAIDLTHQRGLLCGQILADLGADVIQVEPPGGSPVRAMRPFRKDEPELLKKYQPRRDPATNIQSW